MHMKIDDRIRRVLENCSVTGHRSLVVLVGEKSKDQVVYIHNILTNTSLKQVSVLWCYKKELELSSSRKKRAKQIKEANKSGGDAKNEEEDLFQKFIETTNVKYCYYKETYRVLGNTFKMCILQDFEGVTANILCRVLETVEGGGAIVLLLQSLDSLKQFYTLCMDVHARYRSFKHRNVVPRFNERLLQSLSSCRTSIVIDDAFRIIEHSEHIANVPKLSHSLTNVSKTQDSKTLKAIKKAMNHESTRKPLGVLINLCKTEDQAHVVVQFCQVISENKSLNTTVSLTAARGRGKSAAMGLAVAAAIAYNFSDMYVTSPSPENLLTFFEFVVKGLNELDYQEGTHYALELADSDHNKCVVGVAIINARSQFIRYIEPTTKMDLSHAQIVVVDEAAAIPLPVVRGLLGPYLVFLSSTVSGYEGTGRALALKLLAELRRDWHAAKEVADSRAAKEIANSHAAKEVADNHDAKEVANMEYHVAPEKGRKLLELTLEESIRYKPGDPVEKWLTELLCLEATPAPLASHPPPPPPQCQLFYVDRDVLFSYKKTPERLLALSQALLVSSHYRNCPDDLQQLSDAPAHRLFVLTAPVVASRDELPHVLVVIQVVLEGGINASYTELKLMTTDGKERPAGDLIPWTISNGYLATDFPKLNGARVLRVATHPDLQGKGYGSHALRLLRKHYTTNCHLASDNEEALASVEEKSAVKIVDDDVVDTGAKTKGLSAPLLTPIAERNAEAVHYLGVSYGITQPLFNFWRKLKYTLIYTGSVPNPLTGEHTAIMVQRLGEPPMKGSSDDWVRKLRQGYKRRQLGLLSSPSFQDWNCRLAMSLITDKKMDDRSVVSYGCRRDLDVYMDNVLTCIGNVLRNQSDSSSVVIHTLAGLYFNTNIADCKLDPLEATILCGVGLQYKKENTVAKDLRIDDGTLIAAKLSLMKKLHTALSAEQQRRQNPTSALPTATTAVAAPTADSVADPALLMASHERNLKRNAKIKEMVKHLKRPNEEDQGDRRKKKFKLDLNTLSATKKLL